MSRSHRLPGSNLLMTPLRRSLALVFAGSAIGLVVPATSARAADGVIYFGATDPRPAERQLGSKARLPRVEFRWGARNDRGGIEITETRLRDIDVEASLPASFDELRGAQVVADALSEAIAQPDAMEVETQIETTQPVPGRYRLTLTLQKAADWETGRVRIVGVGRRLSGDGPAEFRRELDGWFLVHP